MIRVIIADDCPQFIEGLRLLLSMYPGFEIVGTARNGVELLQRAKQSDSDLILLDIEMPVMGGIDAAIQVNYLFPHIPMIALTMYQDSVYLTQLVCAGFKGYVNKSEISTKLMAAINRVLHQQVVFPEDLKI